MPDTTIPKPTTSYRLWGGAVEIHCFGRPQDWSLAGPTALAADMNNPGIRYRMHQLAETYGISRIHAPNPSQFNARIARTDEFDVEWAEERVMRGPLADGVLLTEPGTAFAVSSADCPTAVLRDGGSGNVVFAHAGFKSLLDIGKPPLAKTMADALEGAVGRSKYDQRLQRGFVACGIGHSAYRFDAKAPGFTEEHRAFCERVERNPHWRSAILGTDGDWMVDLATLFRLQAETWSAAREHIGFDGVCTFGDADIIGDPDYHSNRRGDKTRNLVLGIRR